MFLLQISRAKNYKNWLVKEVIAIIKGCHFMTHSVLDTFFTFY